VSVIRAVGLMFVSARAVAITTSVGSAETHLFFGIPIYSSNFQTMLFWRVEPAWQVAQIAGSSSRCIQTIICHRISVPFIPTSNYRSKFKL